MHLIGQPLGQGEVPSPMGPSYGRPSYRGAEEAAMSDKPAFSIDLGKLKTRRKRCASDTLRRPAAA
jgi:hypothetical protein